MPTAALLATVQAEEQESKFRITYLITGLFLFYTAVAANFLDKLVGTGMHQLLQDRRMQHLIGYLLLLFTISLVSGRDSWEMLWLSAVLYLWFLLTTKTHKWFNLAVLLLLALGFFVHQLLKTRYTEAWAGEDVSRQKVRYCLHVGLLGIFALVVGLTVVGNGIYMHRQWRDHRSEFSLMRYIFGGRQTS